MGAVNAAWAVAAGMAGVAIRVSVAAILAIGALHALRDRDDYARIVQAYRLLPATLGRIAAMLLPAAEIVIAMALLLPRMRFPGSLAALALLACFTVAMAINLLRGRHDIACGCGGGTGQMLSWPLVLRNALLCGGLAASLAAPVPPQPQPAAYIGMVGLASFLAALYLAANQLIANAYLLPATEGGRG